MRATDVSDADAARRLAAASAALRAAARADVNPPLALRRDRLRRREGRGRSFGYFRPSPMSDHAYHRTVMFTCHRTVMFTWASALWPRSET
jgi:hypothetical protein